jgi:hypothetical protein
MTWVNSWSKNHWSMHVPSQDRTVPTPKHMSAVLPAKVQLNPVATRNWSGLRFKRYGHGAHQSKLNGIESGPMFELKTSFSSSKEIVPLSSLCGTSGMGN